MSSLREINIFKLKTLISNFDTKISAVAKYKNFEILCLVQEDNKILFRKIDNQNKVTIKLLYWFSDTNRCIQDISAQPSGQKLMILCYDNTLHLIDLETIFDENIHIHSEIIRSFVVPFIGPHECPNTRTCPNNVNTAFSASSTSSQIHDNGDEYSTAKIDEFLKKNILYNNYTDKSCSCRSSSNSSIKNEVTPENSEEKCDNVLMCENCQSNPSSNSASTIQTCPYPTCCLWWDTILTNESRGIIGFSDGTICFVLLQPNCPFIANTSLEKGAIEKLVICKDSNVENVSLMITTTLNEQWKLLLEQKSLSYVFPGGNVQSIIDQINDKSKEIKDFNPVLDKDWQFVIELVEDATSTSVNSKLNQTNEQTTANSTQNEGILPTARARLANLKDVGAKKIEALKSIFGDNRNKSNDKNGKNCDENTAIAVIDVPDPYPEILTTPSGPFYNVQRSDNESYLTALHTYSDTLSVHSTGINLIPLFLYKIPKFCKDVLLTKTLLFTLHNSLSNNSEGELSMESNKHLNMINVISGAISSIKIGEDCDFNEKAMLSQFSFENERIINIHVYGFNHDKHSLTKNGKETLNDIVTGNQSYFKTGVISDQKIEESGNFDVTDVCVMTNRFPEVEYEQCVIVTDKNIYSIEFNEYPHIMFLNLTNNGDWSLCEDFCKTFNISLAQCIEFAGDVFLKKHKISQALLTFNVAKIPPIYTAMKLAMFCECNALMHLSAMALKLGYILKSKHPMNYHIKEIMENYDKKIEFASKCRIDEPKKFNTLLDDSFTQHCSDFSYETDEVPVDLKMTNTSIFHLSNYLLLTLCEKSIRDRHFLPLLNYLATNTRYHSYLASVVLSESGLYPAAVLIAKVRGISLTVFYCLVKVALMKPTEYFDINVLIYNLSDEIFMECISYMYNISFNYFEVIKNHIDRFSIEILERLEKQINPFNAIYRPIISKVKFLHSNYEDNNPYSNDYINWYRCFIETYIIVLIKLKHLTNPESNFISALHSFKMTHEEMVHATNIDVAQNFSAGYSYGACIINNIAYIWGYSGVNLVFDLKSLDMEKIEGIHVAKELKFFKELQLDVFSIKCGRNHFILQTTNGLYAVGCNKVGQLGVGTHLSQTCHPILISSLEGKSITEIAVGQYHNAVVADGDLYTWGWGIFGQLGHENILNKHQPTVVRFFKNKKIEQIALGYSHTLVLCENSKLYVFGSNHFGQLGIGQYIPSHLNKEFNIDDSVMRTPFKKSMKPVLVDLDDEKIRLIHTKYFSNLVVTDKNVLYVWGASPQSLRLASQAKKRARQSKNEEMKKEQKNENNQGDEDSNKNESQQTSSSSSTTTTTTTINPIDLLNADNQKEEEENGANENNEEESSTPSLEENFDHYFPAQLDTSDVDSDIIELSSGLYHYALMTKNSNLYTWGKNIERQLGFDGPREDVFRPTQLNIIEDPIHVECGSDFTLVMTKNYEIKAFGNNNNGQCGREVWKKDYSGRLVKLKSSKRLIRIPEGGMQYIQEPNLIEVPKQENEISSIKSLKKIPKLKKESIIKCNLHDTLIELEKHHESFNDDLGLNELNNDLILSNRSSLNLDKLRQFPSDCVESEESSLVLSNLNLCSNHINQQTILTPTSPSSSPGVCDINEKIHYSLFLFYGLYDQQNIIIHLNDDQFEYLIRILMLEYKFIDAFKLTLRERSTAQKTIKIFEYFTKDSNVFPVHPEDLKCFVYEIFMHFITKGFSMNILENFLLNNLDLYLIPIAYVLYFHNNDHNNENQRFDEDFINFNNNNNNIDNDSNNNDNKLIYNNITKLESLVLEKYKEKLGNSFKHNQNYNMEHCDLIFKSVSSKFTINICQKIIQYSKENLE